jgi:hypothetical protein
MIFSTFALMATLSVAPDATAWVKVDSVRATGFERIADGLNHPFSIARWKDKFVYSCDHDIDGALAGNLRTELVNDKGVFTWLCSSPKWVLQLPYPTAPEFSQSILPIRFTRKDLTQNVAEVQKAIGKRITGKGQGSVAERDCMVLALSDRTPLVQNFWVDVQTGMSLRQQDRIGREVIYDRVLTSLQTDAALPASDFELASSAKVIRGLVSPDILLKASGMVPVSNYDADYTALRNSSQIDGGFWIQKVPTPSGFDYMGSSQYEAPRIPLSQDQSTGNIQPASNSAPVGGVPMGWAVPGGVVIENGTIYFGYHAPSNEEPRMLTTDPASEQIIPFRGYVTMGGNVVLPEPDEKEKPNTKVPPARVSALSIAPALVRSEFLDRSTGDTLTFLQTRNMRLSSLFRGIRLPAATPLTSRRYHEMLGFQIPAPQKLNAVVWTYEDTQYVLVSTRLSVGELQLLAESA